MFYFYSLSKQTNLSTKTNKIKHIGKNKRLRLQKITTAPENIGGMHTYRATTNGYYRKWTNKMYQIRVSIVFKQAVSDIWTEYKLKEFYYDYFIVSLALKILSLAESLKSHTVTHWSISCYYEMPWKVQQDNIIQCFGSNGHS